MSAPKNGDHSFPCPYMYTSDIRVTQSSRTLEQPNTSVIAITRSLFTNKWSFQKQFCDGHRLSLYRTGGCLLSMAECKGDEVMLLLFQVTQGNQKLSVHLLITIQKVTSNVQIVPRHSPDIYWHAEGQGDSRLTLTLYVISNSNYVITVSDWNFLIYFFLVFCTVIIRCTETFCSPCITVIITYTFFYEFWTYLLREDM
jgi:hypothetical protein